VRRPLLLDTSLLLLLLAGIAAPQSVGRLKRLREYEREDLERLLAIARDASGLVTTPNIVTELTNLTTWFDAGTRILVHGVLRQALVQWLEVYVPSLDAARDPAFDRIGASDCAVVSAVQGHPEPRPLVVTVDLDLCLLLGRRGLDCLTFNHGRRIGRTRR
jgi:hypothetical protein